MPPDEINAFVVPQWMPEWDEIDFDPDQRQARPDPYFFLFTLPATTLRSLCGIQRRRAVPGERRVDDTSIQRRHDEDRSKEIRRFVSGGYPWSTLSATKRDATLLKPGWLPTAVVVNIIGAGETRQGRKLDAADSLRVHGTTEPRVGEQVRISLPTTWKSQGWQPKGTHPIEVIDGQHRLWAFDDDDSSGSNYALPVVAFRGLDISWQAYLFWTINIKPKKINTSLAFDLYPLLREQDWLEAGEGVNVYRETRAQELTEALWSAPSSPWYQRINMLGETGLGATQPVTQAAFVRNLIAAFVKSWRSTRTPIGGLFGGADSGEGLPWTRVQQAAFLVFSWRALAASVKKTNAPWAKRLRELEKQSIFSGLLDDSELDLAFTSQFSLLASDQGVRPVMHIFNDLCFVRATELKLAEWVSNDVEEVSPAAVEALMKEFARRSAAKFITDIADALATYDWRTSKTPGLDEEDRGRKLVFRGSGGYRELRRQLLSHLEKEGQPAVREAARQVRAGLGY